MFSLQALKKKPAHPLVLCLVVFGSIAAVTRVVKVNLSPSAPYGLYRLTFVPTPLPRGTLVVLPVPASVQPFHAWWVPLLKPVAAVAGDHVCYVWGTLYIEGEPYGVVHEQAHGQWLPQWRGCKNLDEGEVFLASDRPRSLDGRYWGITSLKALTAQALPVLTWR